MKEELGVTMKLVRFLAGGVGFMICLSACWFGYLSNEDSNCIVARSMSRPNLS